MSQPKPVYSYLAAATLALITIFTFYVYRGFGPQSVIRRFHIDAVNIAPGNENHADLDRVSVAPYDQSAATRVMVGFVQDRMRGNATYEIRNIRRFVNQVLVAVEYRAPDGDSYVVWHVRQGPHDWRIDCSATVNDPTNGFRAVLRDPF